LMPSLEGNLLTQRHQITSLETRDSRLSYCEDPESLSHLVLVYHRVVTDKRTDRQTEFPQLIRATAVPADTAVARKKWIEFGAGHCRWVFPNKTHWVFGYVPRCLAGWPLSNHYQIP